MGFILPVQGPIRRAPAPQSSKASASPGIADKLRLFEGGIGKEKQGEEIRVQRKVFGENGEHEKLPIESSKNLVRKKDSSSKEGTAVPPSTPIKKGWGHLDGRAEKKKHVFEIEEKQEDQIQDENVEHGSAGLLAKMQQWEKRLGSSDEIKTDLSRSKVEDTRHERHESQVKGSEKKLKEEPMNVPKQPAPKQGPVTIVQLQNALKDMDADIEKLRHTLDRLQQTAQAC